MSAAGAPELSVILATDHYESIRRTVRHVLAQTALDRIEAVLVAPSREALAADDGELSRFRHLEVVETGGAPTLPEARARGIRAASAPVVVLTETHAFPHPEWAEALIEAHRGPWAAVGPVLANANPETMLSWAALLIAYGQWAEGASGGVVDDVPGHNSSYKRDLLLEYGDRLAEMIEAEARLHAELRERGHQLYLEPRAKIDHVNVSRPASFCAVRYHSGRLFGAARAAGWQAPRKLAYALAAPLIVAVRMRRFLNDLRRPGAPAGLLPRVLPALLLGVVISSYGEAVGSLAGPGSSTHGREDMELHREQHS